MKIRKRIAAISMILVLLTAYFTLPVTAVEKRTVRIGYFLNEGFQEIDKNGDYTGYGYEYLQNLASYSNWEYEFVEGTWSQCKEWLISGEIDMMGLMLKTEENEELFAFPTFDSGYNANTLLARVDREDLAHNSYEDYDGISIGALNISATQQQLKNYAQTNDFTYNLNLYDSTEELYAALETGEVDTICLNAPVRHEWTRVVSAFDPLPFYYAVNKDNTKLLAELEYAIGQINVNKPLFEVSLRAKYYSNDFETHAVFSSSEKEYMAQTTKPIKVAIDPNFMPIEGFDENTKQAEGYTVKMLEKISELTGLQFEYIKTHDYLESTTLLAENKVDILTSVNTSIATSIDNATSDFYLNASVVLVGKNDFSVTKDDAVVIAIPPKTTQLENSISKLYPNAQFEYYDSWAVANREIQRGDAQLIARNIYSAHSDLMQDDSDLKIVYDLGEISLYRFAFSEEIAPELLSIFNKCIDSFSDADKSAMMLSATVSQIEPVMDHQRTIAYIVAVLLLSTIALWLLLHLVKTRQRLVYLAYYDELTGLPNATRFKAKATKTLAAHPNTNFSIIMLDIAGFSFINEQYGFETGNAVLKEVANHAVATNNSLSFIARIASDTFVALYAHDTEEHEFTSPLFAYNNDSVNIKLSYYIGRYKIPKGGEDIDAVYEKVNYVHSFAKKMDKKNEIVDYDEDAQKTNARSRDIELKMEDALTRFDFKVFLQPKFKCDGTTLAGAEALVRWIDSETNSTIFPNEFIPLFEQNGFIKKLDMYMFVEVCKLLQSWKLQNYELVPISVNFSRLHFTNVHLAKTLARIAKTYDVDPKYLEIEITENALSTNLQEISEMISALHGFGFKISLDDFSTQHSSMAFLAEIFVDVVKLDRSFVAPIAQNDRCRLLVAGSIHTLKQLGCTIVAEGVESMDQVECLKEHDCDIIQGFVFAKPAPAEDMAKLLTQSK